MQNDENGIIDESKEEAKETHELGTDDSRANLQVRMTTKERIQKMKDNLKLKREHKKVGEEQN